MAIDNRIRGQYLILFATIFALFNISHAGRNRLSQQSNSAAPVHHQGLNRKFFKFVTRPDIDAPTWRVRIHDQASLEEGYWFVAPYQDLEQQEPGEGWVGPHIYDQSGELIWSGAQMFHHWNTFDFGMTNIGEEWMLSVLYPRGKAGVVMNGNYEVWKEVTLEHTSFDMHAFNLIDGGSRALIITIDNEHNTAEAAKAVGFRGRGDCRVTYGGFAELDVDDPSRPVFTWSSYQHIGLNETTYNRRRVEEECVHGWDFIHANSIDKFADNDYLLSCRHSDAVYKISHEDGSIVWRLGGVQSDFRFLGPENSIFSRQHHAQVLGQDRTHTIVAIFDNAIGTGPNEHMSNGVARGLILLLDTVEWTASVLREYVHPRGNTVSSRGSFQPLANGNAFLCWTYSSHISEHHPNGTVVMEAVMEAEAHTYRAFKYPWVGRPLQPPDVVSHAITTRGGKKYTLVYVSWNGATEVATWMLYQFRPDRLGGNETLGTAARTGFETLIEYKGEVSNVVVEALDRNGNSLGRSDLVHTRHQEYDEVESSRPPLSRLPSMRVLSAPYRPRMRSAFEAFLFAVMMCVVVGSLLLFCSRRRSALLSRSLSLSGLKYDPVMQERL